MLFSRELSIDRSDFELNPPDGFFRLSPGGGARLVWIYCRFRGRRA